MTSKFCFLFFLVIVATWVVWRCGIVCFTMTSLLVISKERHLSFIRLLTLLFRLDQNSFISFVVMEEEGDIACLSVCVCVCQDVHRHEKVWHIAPDKGVLERSPSLSFVCTCSPHGAKGGTLSTWKNARVCFFRSAHVLVCACVCVFERPPDRQTWDTMQTSWQSVPCVFWDSFCLSWSACQLRVCRAARSTDCHVAVATATRSVVLYAKW